jgi:Putative phage abortive infection protein
METNIVDHQVEASGKLQRRFSYLAAAGALFFLVLLIVYFNTFGTKIPKEQDKWGQFGDFLGGVLNPIFSFLALIGLLITIALQVRQLRISAHELRSSEAALKTQNAASKIQDFESSFFQLLRLHNDVINAIDLQSDGNRITKGRDCFKVFVNRLEKDLRTEGGSKKYDIFVTQYEFFYINHEHEIGHYFRLLYNIVKLIKLTDGIDKKRYTNLVRAQLSSYELKLLFYNCISSLGREKFKPLVEEFSLLKTMPNTVLPEDELLYQFSPAAFGGAYPESFL